MEENFFKKKVENIEVKKRKLSELIDLLTFTHILSVFTPFAVQLPHEYTSSS
ncbi:MAG: hypothetical protein UU01_C0034G0001 [Parcubacteria group bacterium GW2011_GWA2_40_37]|nr:MAG: hypothetical protein UU01_C0034G0001 [Parcubacteria group bacterium GW2011_GWA2_40_37]